MTSEELCELLRDCPTLYHMAERGSWRSIKTKGLLSTSALLDVHGIADTSRTEIEARRRSASVTLNRSDCDPVTIRDQLPMDDKGLERCLQDGITPEEWYRLLNSKVFFWLTRERLVRLLNAGTYRAQEHDVLEVDAKSLIDTHYDQICFCPINSGCTKPFPHPRGNSTFLCIDDYPYSHWKTKRKRGERVVELAIDYAVLDIAKHVMRAVRMKGSEELSVLWER
ncbi:MAG: DUF7002 family protein [Methylovirgula sp.]